MITMLLTSDQFSLAFSGIFGVHVFYLLLRSSAGDSEVKAFFFLFRKYQRSFSISMKVADYFSANIKE